MELPKGLALMNVRDLAKMIEWNEQNKWVFLARLLLPVGCSILLHACEPKFELSPSLRAFPPPFPAPTTTPDPAHKLASQRFDPQPILIP